MMQQVFITGASGLLGRLLSHRLQQAGYRTVALRHRHATGCDEELTNLADLNRFNGQHFDHVINLAGASIAGGLWTQRRKNELRQSRIGLTRALIAALRAQKISIGQLISGSAIGFYGNTTQPVTEASAAGDDFSARLCLDWENTALGAEDIADTVCLIRTGLVLTEKGGFLQPQRWAAQLGLASVLGTGTQGLSWIDYRDWLAAVDWLMKNKASGAYNLTSPIPVSQRDFSRTLSSTLNRPCLLRVPELMFRPLGEMSDILTGGQWVMPERLSQQGFQFEYPNLQESLTRLLNG